MRDPTPAEIRKLLDEQEIRAVLARYCRGVDRVDRELIASVYHPDALDNHGIYDGPVEQYIEGLLTRLRTVYLRTTHILGSTLIELDGDVARVETYAFAVLGKRAADGSEIDISSGLRYLDRFERRNGGAWLIAKRQVVYDWSRVEPATERRADWDLLAKSPRDRSDPVYQL
jgi:hypothetical protein